MTMSDPRNVAVWLERLMGNLDDVNNPEQGMRLFNKIHAHFPGRAIGQTHVQLSDATPRQLPDMPLAMSAMIQVQQQPVRWTVSPDEPTTTEAFRHEPGTIIVVTGRHDLRAFRHRNDGTFDASLVIQFYL